jgi:RecB family exonuclease
VPFRVELAAGEATVVLTGRVDRVERDAAGAVRIVDLKNGRTVITKSAVAGHVALGAYQAAVAAGGVCDLVGPDAVCGGAELVMLRQPDRNGWPKIQSQAPVTGPEGAGRFREHLELAAGRLRGERFDPVPSADCETCQFRRCCSAHAHGGGSL